MGWNHKQETQSCCIFDSLYQLSQVDLPLRLVKNLHTSTLYTPNTSEIFQLPFKQKNGTLPETNIFAPENVGYPERKGLSPNHSEAMLVSGRVC